MDDVSGLWTVEFTTPMGRGSGVAYFRDGLIHGGDAFYYYVGRYSQTPSGVQGTLEIQQFNSAGVSVFGPIRNFVLAVSGAVRGDLIMAQGAMEVPHRQTISLKLARVVRD